MTSLSVLEMYERLCAYVNAHSYRELSLELGVSRQRAHQMVCRMEKALRDNDCSYVVPDRIQRFFGVSRQVLYVHDTSIPAQSVPTSVPTHVDILGLVTRHNLQNQLNHLPNLENCNDY